ncbi:MAG: ABC transporter permease [Alphaproteobacteria bacterium]|nr:ABC transporter permease [Alphaproteobacteria bacterium]MBL0717824.1 ABC transporter permease [Alphaproteobacteria bacterium]
MYYDNRKHNFITKLGAMSLAFFERCGLFFIFTFKSFYYLIFSKIYWSLVIQHIKKVGFYSIPVVGLTALFSGMVLAYQTSSGFADYAGESSVAIILLLSTVREMGPVFTGLMLSGRCSSSFAAEIGTMQISEQVDAIKVMPISPFVFIVKPRLLASIIVTPLLVVLADVVGLLGGFLIAWQVLNYNPNIFLETIVYNFEKFDLMVSVIKGLVFGVIIGIVGTFFGMLPKVGARSVGLATTQAVVTASILVLCLNYLITNIFY